MIEILFPGPLSTVQDGGRNGYMRFGVSRAGAMDRLALSLANLLVGNEPDEGAVEATLAIPSLRFTEDTLFAVTGGRCALKLAGRDVPMDTAVRARAGETLACAVVVRGCRAYIAFAGGLGLQKTLGSLSCDKKAKIGGLGLGEKLACGDMLPNVMPEQARFLAGRTLPAGLYGALPEGAATLRVTAGPQAQALDAAGERALFSNEYAVLPESDRMGIRFSGPALSFASGCDGNIITDAVAAGAIQITGSGLPILMMADAQTSGGYTKPAWVISVDLPTAAQLRPGDKVRFVRCSVEDAQSALAERQNALKKLSEKWKIKHMNVKTGSKTYEIFLYET